MFRIEVTYPKVSSSYAVAESVGSRVFAEEEQRVSREPDAPQDCSIYESKTNDLHWATPQARILAYRMLNNTHRELEKGINTAIQGRLCKASAFYAQTKTHKLREPKDSRNWPQARVVGRKRPLKCQHGLARTLFG